MKLPKQEDFAILLMGELTQNYGRRLVPLSEISASHGVSLLFLKKIVRALRLAGLVISKEGAAGGYTLAKDPGFISLWEIIRAVGEENSLMRPKTVQAQSCPVNLQCLPQTLRKTIFTALSNSLSAITLKEVVPGRSEK